MTAIKMFVTIRRRPHISQDRFHDHWRHPHGTWGRGIANITSYVQSHRIDTPRLGSQQAEIDGVVEVGFENMADVSRMSDDPAYVNFLKPDEPGFVENTGLGFMTEEVLRSGEQGEGGRWPWREAEQAVSVKLIQVFRGAPPAAAQHDDAGLADALGALRHVNAAPAPAAPPEANGIAYIRQLWWPTVSDFEDGVARAPDAWKDLLASGANAYTGLFKAERFV